MYNRLLFPGRFMSGVVIRNRRIFALIAVAAFLFLAVGLFPASASIMVNNTLVTTANAANVLGSTDTYGPTVRYDSANETLYVNTSTSQLYFSNEGNVIVIFRDSGAYSHPVLNVNNSSVNFSTNDGSLVFGGVNVYNNSSVEFGINNSTLTFDRTTVTNSSVNLATDSVSLNFRYSYNMNNSSAEFVTKNGTLSYSSSFSVNNSSVELNTDNVSLSFGYANMTKSIMTINATKPLNIGELNATNSSDVTIGSTSDVTFTGQTGLNLTNSTVTIGADNVTFDKCGSWSIRTNGNSRVNITATSDLIFSECRALNAGARANQGEGDYTPDSFVTLTGQNVTLSNLGKVRSGTSDTNVGFQVRRGDLTINADNLTISVWEENFGGMGIDARSYSTVEINVTGAFNITTFANCINLDHTSGITLDVKDLNLLSKNNYAIVMGMGAPTGANTPLLEINAETVNLEAKFACISTWGNVLINASKNVVMKSNGATEDDLSTNPDARTWGSCIQVAVGGDVEIIGKEVSMTAGYMGVNIDNGDLTINADKLQIDAGDNGLSAENGSVLIESSDVNIKSTSGRGISAGSLTLDLNSTEVAGNATVRGGGDAGI